MIRIAEQYGLTNLVAQKYSGASYSHSRARQEGYTRALDNLRSIILQLHGIEVSLEVERSARVLSITVIITPQ